MSKIIKYHILLLLIFLHGMCYSVFSEDLSELKPYLRKTVIWNCITYQKVVPVNICFLGGTQRPDGCEVIVYPSQSVNKLPAIVYSAWQAARNPNGEPIGYLPRFAGFTSRVYVYVVMGHCYNPCVVNYFHYSKFTLDVWNGLACYTAAMRFRNANANQYSINTEHIGMLGHSKGEYAVTRLSDPHHVGERKSAGLKVFLKDNLSHSHCLA